MGNDVAHLYSTEYDTSQTLYTFPSHSGSMCYIHVHVPSTRTQWRLPLVIPVCQRPSTDFKILSTWATTIHSQFVNQNGTLAIIIIQVAKVVSTNTAM